MPIDLLAFCGRQQAGKTTAAKHIAATLGFSRLSFADPIRRMLLAIGLTAEDLSERKEIPHALLGFKTPRYAMQTVGTEWGRYTIHDDIWLNIARHDIEQARRFPDFRGIVIDDCRFDNEAALVRSLGGVVIHVTRLDMPTVASTHASEKGVSMMLIDGTIAAHDGDENGLRIAALTEFQDMQTP